MTNQINIALSRKWALQGTKDEHLIPTAFRVLTNRTYWNDKGKYQAQYDYVWNNLVPDSGSSDNEHIEAIRCVGRLYYEYYNNGNCNTYNRYTENDYYVYEINEYYKEMVRTIEDYLELPFNFCIEDSELAQVIKPIEINDYLVGEYLEGLIDRTLRKALPQITLL